MEVAPYSPMARAKVSTVPDKIPGAAAGRVIFQKIVHSDSPRVRPAWMILMSTCSKAPLAFRYMRGNAMTVAAITHPVQDWMIRMLKVSRRKEPKGRLTLNNNSKKNPATVGGRTKGSVRMLSMTARSRGDIRSTSYAAPIPRKKEISVAAKPVFKDMNSGLQSSDESILSKSIDYSS